MLIMRDIAFGDRRQFRQLQSQMKEGITPSVLSDRLTRLVGAGVLRKAAQGPGRPTVYSLTESGIQLIPVLITLGGWGARHGGIPEALQTDPQELEAAGPERWNLIMEDLRSRHLEAQRV